jgi:hypothetical protein
MADCQFGHSTKWKFPEVESKKGQYWKWNPKKDSTGNGNAIFSSTGK